MWIWFSKYAVGAPISLRELHHAARFGEVARQRLLADEAAQPRAVARPRPRSPPSPRPGTKLALKIATTSTSRAISRTLVEHARLAEPALARRCRELVRRRARREARDLDAAHALERAQVELR